MNKILAMFLLFMFVIAFSASAAAASYEYLDGMTLEQLLALQDELTKRITEAKRTALRRQFFFHAFPVISAAFGFPGRATGSF